LSLPNKISKLVASIDYEKAVRERYEELLKQAIRDHPSDNRQNIIQSSLHTQPYHLPSEWDRRAMNKFEAALQKIDEIHKSEFRTLIMLFDD
jgi:two-component sensor histidine kinase